MPGVVCTVYYTTTEKRQNIYAEIWKESMETKMANNISNIKRISKGRVPPKTWPCQDRELNANALKLSIDTRRSTFYI